MKTIFSKSLLSGVALALSFSSASAADFGSLKDEPVVAPAPSWSGFYFGGSAGYGHNRSDNNYSDSDGVSSSIKETADGGLLSAIVGFDRQVRDRFVIGAFADFDISDFDRGSDKALNGLTISRAWSVGGRLGYLVSPRMMVFATGGFTQAHFRNDGWWDIEANGVGPTLPGHPSKNFNGYFLGGGMEVMLRSNFFLRGEVRWADYGQEITNAGSFAGTDYVDAEDPEILTARLGIVYKLGRPDHVDVGGMKDGGDGAGDHEFKVVTINGVDVAKDSYAFYSLNLFALGGDFDKDGLVFRTLTVYGKYSYEDSTVPGLSIDAQDRSMDAMLGYHKAFGQFNATVYAGYEIRDIDLSPDDRTNKLRGTQSGFKVALDAESEDNAPFYFSLDGSYSTAFNSFYGELRLGYNAGKFIVGPEGLIFSDEGELTERLGGFVTVPFTVSPTMVGQFTVNGGYQFVEDGSNGSGSRGGEGAYVGSSLKLAF